MQYSNIKELWNEKKILNKLKILNLNYSKHLIKTPNLHSSSLEKLMLEGCSSLVEVHQSVGHLKSLVFLNLKGCWMLKILPQSICDVKSLETLNISGCSELEKFPERMADMQSLIELLADGIENEHLLSSIIQLKYVRKLSLCGYSFHQDSTSSTSWVSQILSWLSPSSTSWTSAISSSISASVLNWKRLLPASFIEWRSLKRLKVVDYGLSECATNCVDFGGMSSLEMLNRSGNKFFSLPSGIGVLPKLRFLRVRDLINLVSISKLPSNLKKLNAFGCTSMVRVRLPIRLRKNPNLCLYRCPNLIEVQGMEGLSNHGWIISSHPNHNLSNNYKKSLVEALCNGGYGYHILFYNGKMPDWFSYHGEGCALSFHIPPIFQGLVVWVVGPFGIYTINAIIKNKRNNIQLFEATQAGLYSPVRWVRYISISEMAMEEYCGEEELELYVNLGSKDIINVKQCGIHVIIEKTDSFEGSEWDDDTDNQESKVGRDRVIPASPYHRLHHLLHGSIALSTTEQWENYLLTEFPLSTNYFVQKFSPDLN